MYFWQKYNTSDISVGQLWKEISGETYLILENPTRDDVEFYVTVLSKRGIVYVYVTELDEKVA